MKKDTRITKELKGTPEATKKKDCQEPKVYSNKGTDAVRKGGAKYRIVDRVQKNDTTWEITFEKWWGCYCTRKTTTVELIVERGRLPLSKHLIKGGY